MYTVLVDDNFHFMDESERLRYGEYESYEEAVENCIKIVNESLNHLYRPGMSPAELYSQYTSFGDDPYVFPAGQGDRFSAWDFARDKCEEICTD
jgi:hypothetical protein